MQHRQPPHRGGSELWGGKQRTILLACTEVKVCSILPCADGHESHPGHHGNKIIKTNPWIFNSGWWMAETESVRAQEKMVACEEVCEGGCSCICGAQAASQVLLCSKGDKNETILVRGSYQSRRIMLGASPSSTWDHSHAWQMCDLVSRVSVVGSLCLLQGGPQASVIAIFTSAVPVLLISVLKLPLLQG